MLDLLRGSFIILNELIFYLSKSDAFVRVVCGHDTEIVVHVISRAHRLSVAKWPRVDFLRSFPTTTRRMP